MEAYELTVRDKEAQGAIVDRCVRHVARKGWKILGARVEGWKD